MVKGGVLNELLASYTGQKNGGDSIKPMTDANGFTRGGLACPKYYFMVALSETGGAYHAIGFRVEHKEYSKAPTLEELKTSTLSIGELEEKIGIDFFCNLPDSSEDIIEDSMNLDD